MIDFEYYCPGSLSEALTLVNKYGDRVRWLAGGTDLIVQMKAGLSKADAVIDVKKIPELNRLGWDDRQLVVGASVPLDRVIAFAPVRQHFLALYQACSVIGSVQVRNRATLGGNVCNAAPSADTLPPLMCLEARVVIAGPDGTRRIPVENFITGPGKTTLRTGEVLVAFEIPRPPEASAGYYLRLTPREEMDIAIVGVAAWLAVSPEDNTCTGARIALGAVAPTPVMAPRAAAVLEGKVITEALIEQAATQTAEAAAPISDIRGSADYRREMVRVLTRRVLKAARAAIE